MAKSSKTDLGTLAKQFDAAFREKVSPLQPEGTITIMQYARGASISRYAARDRLLRLAKRPTGN